MPAIDPELVARILELADQFENLAGELRCATYAANSDPNAKPCKISDLDAALAKYYSKERLESLANEPRHELSMVKHETD